MDLYLCSDDGRNVKQVQSSGKGSFMVATMDY